MEVAKELDIGGANGLRKQDLVFKIMQAKAESEGNYFAGGILDMANDGYGFLRTQGMRPSISDVYVSQTQIRRFALRAGDYVMGAVRQPKDSEKYFGLLRVDAGGRHVMVLLDGITRLTRAYNLALPPSGRTLSGGIDPVALHPPKRLFGAARNVEDGGSLTIIATCLVDTGSRMDEVIFEEFKGTGNWELWLDRRLSEKRVFPAIDIQRSGTRRDDLLLDESTYQRVVLLRRMTALVGQNSQNSTEPTELILERLSRTKSNAEFLSTLKDAI